MKLQTLFFALTTLLLNQQLQAETTKEPRPAGENIPTADQPWKKATKDPAVPPTQGVLSLPSKAQEKDPSIPPTKGVISVKSQAHAKPASVPPTVGPIHIPMQEANIDPGDEERPAPTWKGLPPLSSTTAIDPGDEERPVPGWKGTNPLSSTSTIDPADEERPIPPKNFVPGSKSKVTIFGIGPGRGLGGLDPLGRSQTPAEKPVAAGPNPLVPPEVRRQKIDEINDPVFLPPGQVGVLKSIANARHWAKTLNYGDIDLYSVNLTAASLLGATIIAAYQTLSMTGRQKAFAAVGAPALVMTATGRVGYRIPRSDFSDDDVKAVAEMIGEIESDEVLAETLADIDDELYEYFVKSGHFVQEAKKIEWERNFSEMCAESDQCL